LLLGIEKYPCGTYIADTALFVDLDREHIQTDSGHRRTKGERTELVGDSVQGRSMRRLEGVLENDGVAEKQLADPPKFEVVVM